jgi:ubiquinone/menaquinone biosynthesis C-methylase UbiE
MMNREYWNRVAEHYEDEIFDVIRQDRRGLVLSKLDRYGDTRTTASDIGCGTGNFLPSLASRFRHVVAVDISHRCIERARARCETLANVSFLKMDVASQGIRLPKVDLALSVNSFITPSLTQRTRILSAVTRHLRASGHLILVVPSLESAMLTNARLIEWNLRSGVLPSVANRAGFGSRIQADNRRLHEGIVPIDGVLTKHYTREELAVILGNSNMRISDTLKIEYPWNTEFSKAPGWMRSPYPWDWLCVAQKLA